MIKKSLPLRVLAISFLVLALPLIVDSFLFFQRSFQSNIASAKGSLTRIADFRAISVVELQPVKQLFLKEIDYFLELGKAVPTLPNEDLNKRLEEFISRPLMRGLNIYILNLDAPRFKILASNDKAAVGTTFLSYVKLQRTISDEEAVFLRYHFIPETKTYVPYMYISRIIHDPDTKQPAGIVMVSAEISKEIAPFLAPAGVHNQVKFALLNIDGVVFAATDPHLARNLFDPITPERRQEIIAMGQFGKLPLPENTLPVVKEAGTSYFQFLFKEKIYIAYRSPIRRLGISVVAYSSKDKIFGIAIAQFVVIYVVYGIILIAGGAITTWMSNWMARPLKQLSDLMGKVEAGDMNVRFREEKLGFEINALGGVFNQTLEALLGHIQRAEDERVLRETYRKEIEIGQEVQRNLFPKKTKAIKEVEVAEVYIPAAEVGGDFYDIFVKKNAAGDETLFLAIADAAGKGVSACLYSLGVRSMLRANVVLFDDIAKIMSETNNLFIKDTGETGMFITALAGFYSPKSREFSYYSCGHVPGIVRRVNGEIVHLTHSGMAMGLVETSGTQADSITLNPGDVVVFYCDGISDAVNERGKIFSELGIVHCLQRKKLISAAEIAEGIALEVKEFMGPVPQSDDITLLVMRVIE